MVTSNNALAQSGINYDEMLGIIRAVALSSLGKHPEQDMIDDLVSEGWVVVLEKIRYYQPDRKTRVSSFVWRPLKSRIRRFIKKTRMFNFPPTVGIPDSIAGNDQISLFESNPYKVNPYRHYYNTEICSMWQQVKSIHAPLIQDCLITAPSHSNSMIRKQYSRRRLESIKRLRNIFTTLSKCGTLE